MRGALLIAATVLISACIGASQDPTARNVRTARGGSTVSGEFFSGTGTTEVSSQMRIEIRLDDVGWGRLELRAKDAVSMNVTVTHDAYNLQAYREPNNPYDAGNFTFIRVFHAVDGPRAPGAYRFQWWGDVPGHTSTPTYTGQSRGAAPLQLKADESAVLLVGTTQPGFRVTLLTGPEEGSRQLALGLQPHPQLIVVVPPPVTTFVHNQAPVHVAVRKSVSAQLELGPAIATAKSWDVIQDGQNLGVDREEFFFGEGSPPTTPATPSPKTASGAWAAGYRGEELLLPTGGKPRLSAVIEYTAISTGKLYYGAAVAVLPLAQA